MAKREDFKQGLIARRKHGKLEIAGTLVIWLAPVLEIAFVIAWNWDKLWKQDWTFHLPLWVLIVSAVVLGVYMKWGRIKLMSVYTSDNAKSQKHHPLLVIINSIMWLLPIVFGILIIYVLKPLGEPIEWFLIALLIMECVGRGLLIADSFQEEEYY